MTIRRSKKISLFVSLLMFIAVVFLSITEANTRRDLSAQTNATTFRIVGVVDGDTIDIDYFGKTKSVRLIGMDTPETKDPRKPVQCFGREASEQAKKLFSSGIVRLEFDPVVGEKDRYDRLLAYAWLSDGRLYNQVMIAEGFAHEYTYDNQSYKYQSLFRQAEASATQNLLGFWSPSTCGGDTKKADSVIN